MHATQRAIGIRCGHPFGDHGVDAALELVSTPTLPDTLHATRVHGTVCVTGMLSNPWIVKELSPRGYIPNRVRLTAYRGERADTPSSVLQRYLDRIVSGQLSLGPVQTYPLDEILSAHDDMESHRTIGKQVVVL